MNAHEQRNRNYGQTNSFHQHLPRDWQPIKGLSSIPTVAAKRVVCCTAAARRCTPLPLCIDDMETLVHIKLYIQPDNCQPQCYYRAMEAGGEEEGREQWSEASGDKMNGVWREVEGKEWRKEIRSGRGLSYEGKTMWLWK